MNENDMDFGGSAVESAYKASGKGSWVGLALMILFGLFAAPAAGVLIHFGGESFAKILGAHGVLYGIVGLIMMFIIIPGLSGAGIAWAISKGAIIGKSRDPKTGTVIAVVCSLIGISIYSFLRHQLYGNEAFDSAIDIVKVILALACTTFCAANFVAAFFRDKPFCENCKSYMKLKRSRRLNRKEQAGVVDAAKANKYKEVVMFFAGEDVDDEQYAIIEYFYCEKCMSNGFFNIRAYIETEEKGRGQTSTNTKERLVFTKRLYNKDIHLLEENEEGLETVTECLESKEKKDRYSDTIKMDQSPQVIAASQIDTHDADEAQVRPFSKFNQSEHKKQKEKLISVKRLPFKKGGREYSLGGLIVTSIFTIHGIVMLYNAPPPRKESVIGVMEMGMAICLFLRSLYPPVGFLRGLATVLGGALLTNSILRIIWWPWEQSGGLGTKMFLFCFSIFILWAGFRPLKHPKIKAKKKNV